MEPYVIQNMPFPSETAAGRALAEPTGWIKDTRFWTLVTMRSETDRQMIADRQSLLVTVNDLQKAVKAAVIR